MTAGPDSLILAGLLQQRDGFVGLRCLTADVFTTAMVDNGMQSSDAQSPAACEPNWGTRPIPSEILVPRYVL